MSDALFSDCYTSLKLACTNALNYTLISNTRFCEMNNELYFMGSSQSYGDEDG